MNYRSSQFRRCRNIGLIAIVFSATWVGPGRSQYQPYGPKNYTSYYMQHVENYHRPPVNPRDYTFDKYFATNPNISPYLNLARHNPYGNNYYQRVLPEVERRAAVNQPMRQKPVYQSQVPTGVVASAGPIHSAMPTPAQTGVRASGKVGSNPYFNKYYNFGK